MHTRVTVWLVSLCGRFSDKVVVGHGRHGQRLQAHGEQCIRVADEGEARLIRGDTKVITENLCDTGREPNLAQADHFVSYFCSFCIAHLSLLLLRSATILQLVCSAWTHIDCLRRPLIYVAQLCIPSDGAENRADHQKCCRIGINWAVSLRDKRVERGPATN